MQTQSCPRKYLDTCHFVSKTLLGNSNTSYLYQLVSVLLGDNAAGPGGTGVGTIRRWVRADTQVNSIWPSLLGSHN